MSNMAANWNGNDSTRRRAMIVIAKDAETKLLEDLRICRQENPVERCFYMAFSSADVPKEALFESFLKLLQDVPDSYKAQVYICHDRDVFILMQGFMQRQFTDFLKKLAEDIGKNELTHLADVMEVGVHWAKLETLCQRKIEKIQIEQAKDTEERRKEIAEKMTLDVLGKLNPELVTTIAKRREERPSPVIMVVDDDQIARTLVGNVVRENYDCTYAKDGKSALMEYVASAPDVLFLDIGLPDINGHDVLECLFQIDPAAYIIMFSGRKDKQNIMRALESGAQGFIGKPFTREKLYQYILHSPHLLKKLKRQKNYVHSAG